MKFVIVWLLNGTAVTISTAALHLIDLQYSLDITVSKVIGLKNYFW